MKVKFFLNILIGILISFSIFVFSIFNPQYFSSQGKINPLVIREFFDGKQQIAIFNNEPIEIPKTVFEKYYQPTNQVMGSNTSNKKIEIDLTNQQLYAYENDWQVYNFPVSTGTWGRTPTGTFQIWIKIKSAKMSGGSKELGTYYYLPNVPYIMYFYNDQFAKRMGYGIHGAYWHNNFGTPMSHGCINLHPEDAELLYYWAEPDLQGRTSVRASQDNLGTMVQIYGKAPNY